MARHRRTLPTVFILAGTVIAASLVAHTLRLLLAPRRERRTARSPANVAVPDSPSDDGADLQHEASGVGELTHRRYRVEVPRSSFTSETLIHEIEQRMRELTPSALAAFEKSTGSSVRMAVGDEYDITMLGPWNGRVRIAEVTDSSFTLVTLDGHPEAGHITFSVNAVSARPDTFDVVVESWARARDKTVQVAYDTLSIGRRVQTEVWVTFLQRVAELTGSDVVPPVTIDSESLAT